eukprot:2286402-Ditylum_brightwellii.AAC.1
MHPALLDGPLSKYKESKVLLTKSKTQWKTGSGKFEPTGQLTVENVCLPSFTRNRRFGVQFDFLPTIVEGHNYQIILGMKDFKALGLETDLEKDCLEWRGISIPMVKHGFWKQEQIRNFWQAQQKECEPPVNQPEATAEAESKRFEYYGATVLEANKYKAPDLQNGVLEEEKYVHLTGEQKEKLLLVLEKHAA